MIDVMSPLWKFLLPLVVALPLGGFVVGSLVTVANDEPPPRPPIELRDETTEGDDRGKRDGSGDDEDDRRGSPVPGITPRPGEVDDDGTGDGDDDDPVDDDGTGDGDDDDPVDDDADTDDDGGGEDDDDGGDDGDD